MAPGRVEWTDRTFPVMGTTGRVLVLGGTSDLATRAELRLAELELRWTRFREDSELMRLNRTPGRPVRVSNDTFAVVSLAIDAWRRTCGFFDPTGLAAIVRLGYDRDFADVGGQAHAVGGWAGPDRVRGNRARPDRAHDRAPGGRHARSGRHRQGPRRGPRLLGAAGRGCDLRLCGSRRRSPVRGRRPLRGAWEVDCAGLGIAPDGTRLRLTSGAVATSTTRRRRWSAGGITVHHLIDPATGRPAASRRPHGDRARGRDRLGRGARQGGARRRARRGDRAPRGCGGRRGARARRRIAVGRHRRLRCLVRQVFSRYSLVVKLRSSSRSRNAVTLSSMARRLDCMSSGSSSAQ